MYDDDDMVSASPLDTFIAEGWIAEALHEVKYGVRADHHRITDNLWRRFLRAEL